MQACMGLLDYFGQAVPVNNLVSCTLIFLRLWRYINHVGYLLTYLLSAC